MRMQLRRQRGLLAVLSLPRAIPAFAGGRCIGRECAALIVERQREDGGWGWFERSTIEETAHCVLGLSARATRVAADRTALTGAILRRHCRPAARRVLPHLQDAVPPDNIVEAMWHAAMRALTRLGVMPVTDQPSRRIEGAAGCITTDFCRGRSTTRRRGASRITRATGAFVATKLRPGEGVLDPSYILAEVTADHFLQCDPLPRQE